MEQWEYSYLVYGTKEGVGIVVTSVHLHPNGVMIAEKGQFRDQNDAIECYLTNLAHMGLEGWEALESELEEGRPRVLERWLDQKIYQQIFFKRRR